MLNFFRSQLYLFRRSLSVLGKFEKDFKERYPHTRITPTHPFDMGRVEIGRFSYGPLKILMWNNPNQKLTIGTCVSIAGDVVFILGGNHHLNTISTYAVSVEALGDSSVFTDPRFLELTNGPITVEDDVWIGTGATIMSGVTIGQGAVIAACSVVTKDVPAYSVVGGNPAKVIKKRFDDAMIDKLLERADYSKLSLDKMEKHIDLFYQPLTELNVDEILRVFED